MSHPIIIESRWTPAGSHPLGEFYLATLGDQLVALDYRDFAARYRQLLQKGFPETEMTEGEPPPAITSALDRYFAGELTAIDALPIVNRGTAFQLAVWRALREIPAGETWSYGQLAAYLGAPKAVRAVGRTNGLNPVAIVGPCHRVVGANGKLTGYAGGLERKRWLLDHEAANANSRLL